MTSYQVMCSVLRPPDPTSQCQIPDFQEKIPQHLDRVFQDLTLAQGRDKGSSNLQRGQQNQREEGDGGEDNGSSGENDLMLCAVVSKTSASFSGADSYKSRVRLPFFWCNWCPFDTESKSSLLQHIVSQHCFICRFCPYVALSRFEVICHSLKDHPQFSQFREQRLKACHLKRDLFQLHFDPRSDCQQARKRAASFDSSTDPRPAPKHCRGSNVNETVIQAVDKRLVEEESSSESADDLPMQFSMGKYLEKSASSHPSTFQDEASVTTHVMENVVSSSGMELDMGIDQTLTSRSGPSETCLYPEKKGTSEQPITVIKQEKESDEAEFGQALGRNLGKGQDTDEDTWKRDEHATPSPVVTDIHVKQEPMDESSLLNEVNSVYKQRDHHGHILSRSVSSPPLSNIRVENLQRQFEESFGVHSVAMTSTEKSEFQHSEPHSLHLIAQPGRIASHLVENFLIDPPQSTPNFPGFGDDRSSPSMLRHLLTRPLHESLRQSPVHRVETVHAEQENSLSEESERPHKQNQERDVDFASTAQLQDNFLLMSDKQHFLEKDEKVQKTVSDELKNLRSSNTESTILCQLIAASVGRQSPGIKQEPKESADDYSTALNLIASAAAGPEMTNFQEWVWGQQNSNMKSPSNTPRDMQKEAASTELLPIIRSILLSQPPHKKREGRTPRLDPQPKKGKDDEEEDIAALIKCETCQQLVPENTYNQHGCVLSAQKTTQTEEKEKNLQSGASSSDTPTSSQQQQQCGSLVSDTSHSKLLAALATRHSNPHAAQPPNTFSVSVSTSKLPSTSTTHPSLISLLTQNEKFSLRHPANPQSGEAKNPRSSNPVVDQLAKFQLTCSANPSPAHGKPAQNQTPVHNTIRSILSSTLRQKSEDDQRGSCFSFPSTSQDNSSHLKASDDQPNKPAMTSSAKATQQVKDQHEVERQSESVTVTKSCADLGLHSVEERDDESAQISTKSLHPPLMSFLRQQGDQVRQVLGNILDDQEESSLS